MAQFEADVVSLDNLSWDYIINARYQPFWVFLNSICKTFGSFTMLQIMVAWIFNGSIFYFLRRATNKFFTALLIFYLTSYFYFSMEIMRESLAVAMVLVAIVRYNDRRIFSFFIWLVAATLFHKFAFFVVIGLILTLDRLIPVFLKAAVSFIIIIFLASLDNPLEYIASSAILLQDLNLHLYEVNNELTFLGLVYNLLRIAPILFVLLWYRTRLLPDLLLRKEVLFPLCWAFVFIILVRIISIPFMDRISNYFVFFVLVCLVSSLADLTKRAPLRLFRRPVVLGASSFGFIFYVLPLLQPDPLLGDIPTYRRYYPYSSVFFKQTDSDREFITYIEAKE